MKRRGAARGRQGAGEDGGSRRDADAPFLIAAFAAGTFSEWRRGLHGGRQTVNGKVETDVDLLARDKPWVTHSLESRAAATPADLQVLASFSRRSAEWTFAAIVAQATLRYMSQLAPRHSHTFADYLETEEISRVRHEFYAGEIYALAGGTPEHAAMAAVITASLVRQLEGTRCRAYSSDLRVRVLATGLATYPDVTVVCGPSERDPESPTHVTNPRLVVEVLSPGTEAYDRGEKLEHYEKIPTLSAVVLVDHLSERVDLWSREGEIWSCARFGAGDVVPLEAIHCSLSVDDVYRAARQA